jgi:hypothetical protein
LAEEEEEEEAESRIRGRSRRRRRKNHNEASLSTLAPSSSGISLPSLQKFVFFFFIAAIIMEQSNLITRHSLSLSLSSFLFWICAMSSSSRLSL